MRQVPRAEFEALLTALMLCLAKMTNVDGLRIAVPAVTEEDLENAACIALMSLTRDWVRPDNIKFFAGFGATGTAREF